MLLPDWEPVRDPDVLESVPLDPEPARVITPGQPQDLSGLNAMQRLDPAGNSDRHFLVPLPPNTDPASPELFSFFTYEIRVGHGPGAPADPFWSTAQARFGEAMTLEGVQHPPPELVCSVTVGPGRAITARAPFATPYLGLQQVTPWQPNTEIWFVSTRGSCRPTARAGATSSSTSGPAERPASASRCRWRHRPKAGGPTRRCATRSPAPASTPRPRSPSSPSSLPEPNGSFTDPLRGDLGQVRVLRTSPLASVEEDCCLQA